MNIQQIDELRKYLPNCYKDEIGSLENFDDSFFSWPTNAIPKKLIEGKEEENDRDRESLFDREIDEIILDTRVRDEDVLETAESIAKNLDIDQPFPGEPGSDDGNVTIDTLAFYLPYHVFKPKLWGIYLLVEGVASLAQQYRKIEPTLNSLDSVRLAKAFLFYHESFHNCVETFATRMEISNRLPFYNSGVRYLYLNTPSFVRGSKLFHEEAFANKYATEKASEYFGKNIYKGSKEFSKNIINKNIRQTGIPKYKDSLEMRTALTSRDYKEKISEFQEEIYQHSLQNPGAKLPMAVWKEFGGAMKGNLPLGSKCSYITSKNSQVAKRAQLGGKLFKTKKLETYLSKLGASFGKSNVHQKKIVLNGRKTDLPINRDIDPHTATQIIKKLNLIQEDGKRHNFTTLRDAILRG